MLISWPAFTTSDGKAVAAGSLSVQLGSEGTFAASLAPNTGAQPAGVYYKVVYQLADDTVQPAWAGEYTVISDILPGGDVWPGDAVQVNAPSRKANFSAVVREVDVQVKSLAHDRSEYTIRFANDAADPLASRIRQDNATGAAAAGVHDERAIGFALSALADGGAGDEHHRNGNRGGCGNDASRGGRVRGATVGRRMGRVKRRKPGGAIHDADVRAAKDCRGCRSMFCGSTTTLHRRSTRGSRRWCMWTTRTRGCKT